MVPVDVAFAQMVNKTAQAYISNAPTYMTYRERTHITASGPFVKANREIDRSIMVRQADDAAVMKDLPDGATTRGQAWPIIPYFDPFTGFGYHYYVNLKAITITLDRPNPFLFTIPETDNSADAVVFYIPFWAPRYGSDNFHFDVAATTGDADQPYPEHVVVDPATGIPSHIDVATISGKLHLSLDYAVVQGHWLITHGTVSSQQGPFHGDSEVTFDQFAFPATAPDPSL